MPGLATSGAVGALFALVLLGPSPGWARAGGASSHAPRWQIGDYPRCPAGHDTKGRRLKRRANTSCAPAASAAPVTPQRVSRRPARRASRPIPSPTPPPTRERPAASLVSPHRDVSVPTLHGPNATAAMGLSRQACEATLAEYDVPFERRSTAAYPAVEQPIFITGPIRGVTFTIPWSRDPSTDHHMVWDCRLAVAMIPVAEFLAAHGVTGVDYVSVLRRGGRSRSRHRVGLAMDLVALRQGETRFRVLDHFPRGTVRNCAKSRSSRDAPGALFSQLTCELWRAGSFHTILTPDYDKAHQDHLHLDLKPDRDDPPDPYVGWRGSGIGSPFPGE